MNGQGRGATEVHFSDGSVITSFQEFDASSHFTDPLDRFSISCAPPHDKIFEYDARLQKGELVTLKINGASQGAFLIETVRTRVSDRGGVSFHVEAVSPLITPYQGSVDPDIVNVHSQTDVPLADTILKALGPYGFDRIVYDSRAAVQTLTGVQVRGKKPETVERKLKIQDAQAQHGESAYAFCARLFTHLAVCLRMAPSGTLLVGAPDYLQDPIYSLTQGSGEGDRFIGDVERTDTNDDQFSEVVARGGVVVKADTSEATRPEARVTAAEAFSQTLSIYKSTPANYKPKVIQDKHARDTDRARSVCTLVHGLRASKAFQIQGSVDGFVSKTGAVWSVDTTASVRIEAIGFDANMWILGRKFRESEQDGQKTTLTIIPLGSLQLGQVPE